MYSVNIIDTAGEQHSIEYNRGDFRNLMELIVNSIYEEIGDCKGRAWCGTCLVENIAGLYTEIKSITEQEKLNEFERTKPTRLSCQLILDEKLNGTTWRVVGLENL